MTGNPSVVTPERFTSGLTYDAYLSQIKVNKDRFEQFYEQCQVSTEDAEFFRKAAQHPQGPGKIMVIGEDWCPDVYRGMPAMARIAEAAGIEMRIFPRDQNMDIMNEFLNKGQFLSIPVAVFYTKDHTYIGHWIERPAMANQERAEIEAQVKQEMPNADDQETRAQIRTRTQTRYGVWLQESIKEMRQLLEGRLGTA